MTPEKIDKMRENLKANMGEFHEAFVLIFQFLEKIPGLAKDDVVRLRKAAAIIKQNVAPRDPPGCLIPNDLTNLK